MPDPADPAPEIHELAAAVRAAIASKPTDRPRDALSAFVLAWWRQWPRTFTRTFGDEAPAIVGWADAAVTDPGSYLKLSRIAMAHLATVL
jgi:hypothetical protein